MPMVSSFLCASRDLGFRSLDIKCLELYDIIPTDSAIHVPRDYPVFTCLEISNRTRARLLKVGLKSNGVLPPHSKVNVM